VLDHGRLIEVHVFGDGAVVHPHGEAVTAIGRYTAVRHVTTAARDGDINAVPLVERDTTTSDVDVHRAAQYVHAGHVFVIRYRSLVNVQGGSYLLHGDTAAIIVRYRAAGHVEIVKFLCEKRKILLIIFHQRDLFENFIRFV